MYQRSCHDVPLQKVNSTLQFLSSGGSLWSSVHRKTLSLQVGLLLFGADNQKNHYNNCSKAYCLLQSSLSTIPFFLDNPKISSEIAELICYFNGTISANVVHRDMQPLTTCPLFAPIFQLEKIKGMYHVVILCKFFS